MSIIIGETKNGSAYPHSAYICNDESDFIQRINALAYQQRSDAAGELETAAQAIEYLDSRYAQRTEIITQADFYEGMGNKVSRCALELGWIVDEDEAE